MTHVVVTGAGGFAGGNLASALAARDFQVTAIARTLPRQSGEVRPELVWRKADLLEPGALPSRFDALIHCAAALPSRYPDPDILYARNMAMARAVFSAAAAAGARTVVNCSSMSVYGAISVPVVIEDLPARDPDAYGRAKRDAEDLLSSLAPARGISALSIRLPGTVGRGSHHNFLSDALARVLAGEEVTARNPDAPFNNVVYVGDLAGFIADWLCRPRAGTYVTNLAAEEPMSIRAVLSFMFVCATKPQRLVFAEGDRSPFLIALDRARSLGYRPATVRESLSNMVRDWLAP